MSTIMLVTKFKLQEHLCCWDSFEGYRETVHIRSNEVEKAVEFHDIINIKIKFTNDFTCVIRRKFKKYYI